MDSKLRKILTECIRDIETGARDAESCLRQYPDQAAELRPHLELWSGLNAAAKAQPNYGSQQRGKHQLMGALADMERVPARKRMIPAVARVAVVMAAAALLIGGAAGASEAFGGPDVAGEVLSTFGLDNARDHAADQASEEGRGLDTADIAVDDGLSIAGDKANEAAQSGLENAADGPSQAGGEGADAPGGAGADASEDSPHASDSVPDEAQVPDSVPAGPKP